MDQVCSVSAIIIMILIIGGFFVCYRCGVFGKSNNQSQEELLDKYAKFDHDQRLWILLCEYKINNNNKEVKGQNWLIDYKYY